MTDPAGHRSRKALAALLWIFVKTLSALAAVFVLIRVIAPSLMDDHNDIAFWTGVLCWPAAVVVAVGALVWIIRDIRGLGSVPLLIERLPDRD
jgi:hypothetical protein